MLVPARAIENQVFVAYCNRVGQEEELNFLGLSSIVAPDGRIVAQAGAEPALVIADIDTADLDTARSKSCYLKDLKRLERGQDT